ncbi:unnamed protein product [Pleuronectes platessa]|uniref:Uncharacterized protein n=1 Tax=Pleuronectes platessa TaxID=8262 RepID=A0A9N7ZBK8_PLEPL|nr:unnamed protein product [Pleuronectes platessa]
METEWTTRCLLKAILVSKDSTGSVFFILLIWNREQSSVNRNNQHLLGGLIPVCVIEAEVNSFHWKLRRKQATRSSRSVHVPPAVLLHSSASTVTECKVIRLNIIRADVHSSGAGGFNE